MKSFKEFITEEHEDIHKPKEGEGIALRAYKESKRITNDLKNARKEGKIDAKTLQHTANHLSYIGDIAQHFSKEDNVRDYISGAIRSKQAEILNRKEKGNLSPEMADHATRHLDELRDRIDAYSPYASLKDHWYGDTK